jgi:hypothetical protein
VAAVRSSRAAGAQAAAFTELHDGLRGHIVTVTSASEQAFIDRVFPSGISCLGAFQAQEIPSRRETSNELPASRLASRIGRLMSRMTILEST